jgi:hypothetical protein
MPSWVGDREVPQLHILKVTIGSFDTIKPNSPQPAFLCLFKEVSPQLFIADSFLVLPFVHFIIRPLLPSLGIRKPSIQTVMAATNETSFPDRNRGWFQDQLADVNEPMRKLLEGYSGVPSSDVVPHINEIVRGAFYVNQNKRLNE